MSKTTISRVSVKTSVNLTSLQDAIDLIDELDGGDVIPIHTANACTQSILGNTYNFQAMGIACKVSASSGDFLDMLIIGPAEGYWYVARINTSGSTTLKRRVTANSF